MKEHDAVAGPGRTENGPGYPVDLDCRMGPFASHSRRGDGTIKFGDIIEGKTMQERWTR